MRNGKLSKRELATIERALAIMSDWSEWAEADADRNGYEPDTDYCYTQAMNAVVGLGEFVREYGEGQC